MRNRLITVTFLTIAFCTWSFPGDAVQTQSADLPIQIANLKARIQGKNPDEVLAIIQAQFGRETRSIGSGLYIPQWDVAGGLLTFHPFRGPSFNSAPATDRQPYGEGPNVMLIDTHNEVGHSIPGNYQMYTLPNNYRTIYVIGEVELQVDGRYRFKAVTGMLASYVKDASNFFTAHPAGTYRITYPTAVQESSTMENLPDKSAIATLEFIADAAANPDGETLLLDLQIDTSERTLFFTPRKEPEKNVPAPKLNLPEPMMYEPRMYQLEKPWGKFWN